MNNRISKGILAASLAAILVPVVADDELVVYATKDGAAFKGASIVVDGTDEKTVPSSGIVKFDLDAGSHTVELLDSVGEVHKFRFDSFDGQLVDTAIAVTADKAKHFVEAFSRIESASSRRNAPKGTLTGTVNLSGSSVEGATVTLVGSNQSVTTDATGRYELTVPRGEYELRVTHEDASEPQTITTRVVSNITRGKNVYLSSSSVAAPVLTNPLDAIPEGLVGDVEEVMVTATFNPNAFGETEQFSSSVVNTLDFEDLARFGGGDIAAAVVKAPGITVQDGKYVFIRGLGGRYVTSTLNGATMPSTDPTKRTVPLDLFPTNMVEQLDIKKSFIASMPGESTGGTLVINTRSFPDEQAGQISVSLGGNTWVTGHEVKVDPSSGAYDEFGWDDGTRAEPIEVNALAQALEYREYMNDETIAAVQRAAAVRLIDNWDYDTTHAGPDYSLSANLGDLFYTPGNSELGVFAALNYKNYWKRQDEGESLNLNQAGGVEDSSLVDQVSHNVDFSGLLSMGLNIGESTLKSTSIVTRATESVVQYQEGFDGDALENYVQHTIQWEERQFLSQQFSGEHFLGPVFAEWQVSAMQASRLAPDRREVRFSQDAANLGGYSLEVSELIRRYDDLVDNNVDGSADFSFDQDISGAWSMTVDFGLQGIHRERDSDSVTYGFDANAGFGAGLFDLAPNLLVSDVINVDTTAGVAGTDLSAVYPFQNKTLASDSYEAEMDLNSYYLSLDNSIGDKLQLILGARVEDFLMETDTFSLTQVDDFGNPIQVQGVIDESNVLPALAVNYSISDSQQLRLSATKTISRPDFKEASNAVFYDNDFTDVRVRGNANIKPAEVINFDLRWEMYFGEDDKISVAYFQKDLGEAIERVALTASGTAGNSRTFENADEAELQGIEVDMKKDFFTDSLSNEVFVQVNYARIESEATTGSLTRALQGQPSYTSNFIVGWNGLNSNQEATLIFNKNGNSIRDVGAAGDESIMEQSRLQMDFNYKWNMSEAFVVKAKIQNITDEDVEFTQGDSVFRKYRKGTGFEAGFDWKF